MKVPFYGLAIFFILLFCWAGLAISNRSEADDGFEYARMAEVENHPWHFHPHHLCYGKTVQLLYRGAQGMGYCGRAYPLLVGFSMVSSLASWLLFFRFCRDRYNASLLFALLATGGLAFSYGFWRYSFEAEVILPSVFFGLWAFYLATRPTFSKRTIVFAAGISALAVLFHIMNGLVAFVAIPLVYLLRRRYRSIVVHGVISAGIIGVAYALVFSAVPPSGDEGALPGVSLHLSQIAKGSIGFGQCLVSGNFLFGSEVFCQKMSGFFPSRMLAEEIYLGSKAGSFAPIFPWITLVGLIGMSGWLGLKVVSRWKRLEDAFLSILRSDRGEIMVASGVWFLLYSVAILIMEPGNPEVWVLGLLPFGLVVAGVWFALFQDKEWWFLGFVLLLALHNGVGGMLMLSQPEGDYNQMKAQWVVENTTEEDRILSAGNPVFIRYLRYHTQASVVDLNESDPFSDDSFSGRVFVLGDVFNYPSSMGVRFPMAKQRIDEYAALLKPVAERVQTNAFGGIWTLSN